MLAEFGEGRLCGRIAGNGGREINDFAPLACATLVVRDDGSRLGEVLNDSALIGKIPNLAAGGHAGSLRYEMTFDGKC